MKTDDFHSDEGLRDYFAAAALQGLLACPEGYGIHSAFAKNAYQFADAMMDERTRSSKEEHNQ